MAMLASLLFKLVEVNVSFQETFWFLLCTECICMCDTFWCSSYRDRETLQVTGIPVDAVSCLLTGFVVWTDAASPPSKASSLISESYFHFECGKYY